MTEARGLLTEPVDWGVNVSPHSPKSMDDTPRPTMPVLGKSPQPEGYCYPVGSSVMNEALADLPMFDRFTLRFTSRSPLFTSNPPQHALPLLRIIYTSYPVYEGKGAASTFGRQGGEKWAIEILTIPYQHRDSLKAKIIERALPLLREWLSGPIPQGVRRIANLCWYEPGRDTVQWLDETGPSES